MKGDNNMKFYGMEKTYLKFYWRAHKHYNMYHQVSSLYSMMHEASMYREEITSLYFANKITSEEYSQKYELVGAMERKVQNLLYEVQYHINQMELDLILI